jgi:hypothetical protein
MMEFTFGQNATLDALDPVPEQFRGAYQQGADGKYVVNPALKGIVEAMDGLNTALGKERTQHGELKKTKDVSAAVAEALGTLGIKTLDEAKAKLTELNELVAANSKVDPAKIKSEIEATFNTEREGFKTQLSGMQATLDKHLVENAALSALSAAKGNPALLMPIVKGQAKVVKDGDDYVVRVLDKDGQYRGDGKGGFMTVTDLVNELKGHADYKVAFASDAPTGGGDKNRQQQTSRQTQQREQQRQGADRSPAELIASGLAARKR